MVNAAALGGGKKDVAVSHSTRDQPGRTTASSYGDGSLSTTGPMAAGGGARKGDSELEIPPEFADAMKRNFAFLGRIFNPGTLFEPLPPALRYSLQRNFGFFTRIFTQFLDPRQGKDVRQSIPGLARKQESGPHAGGH